MLDLVVYIPKLLMNINGGGVAAAAAQYPELHVPNDILLVHDELSREFGKVSFKSGGSASGHNGVRSVQSVLRCHGEARGEPDVARVRLGIGRPPDGNVSSWVLSEMPSAWLAACGVGETADPRSAALPQRVWESVQQWCLAKVSLPTERPARSHVSMSNSSFYTYLRSAFVAMGTCTLRLARTDKRRAGLNREGWNRLAICHGRSIDHRRNLCANRHLRIGRHVRWLSWKAVLAVWIVHKGRERLLLSNVRTSRRRDQQLLLRRHVGRLTGWAHRHVRRCCPGRQLGWRHACDG